MRRNQNLGVSIFGVFLMSSAMWAQSVPAAEKPIPVPTDWSHHHVIFSKPGTTEQAARVEKDPRYWQQLYRRELPVVAPAAERGIASQLPASPHVSKPPKSKNPKGDWQENLGSRRKYRRGKLSREVLVSRHHRQLRQCYAARFCRLQHGPSRLDRPSQHRCLR